MRKIPKAPITKQELAIEYEWSTKTMMRRFKDIGINTKKMINEEQLKAFYEEYGHPFILYESPDYSIGSNLKDDILE